MEFVEFWWNANGINNETNGINGFERRCGGELSGPAHSTHKSISFRSLEWAEWFDLIVDGQWAPSRIEKWASERTMKAGGWLWLIGWFIEWWVMGGWPPWRSAKRKQTSTQSTNKERERNEINLSLSAPLSLPSIHWWREEEAVRVDWMEWGTNELREAASPFSNSSFHSPAEARLKKKRIAEMEEGPASGRISQLNSHSINHQSKKFDWWIELNCWVWVEWVKSYYNSTLQER